MHSSNIVFEMRHAGGKGLITLLRDVTDGNEHTIFILFTTPHSLKRHPWKGRLGRYLYSMPGGVNGRFNLAHWRE